MASRALQQIGVGFQAFIFAKRKQQGFVTQLINQPLEFLEKSARLLFMIQN